MIPNNIAGHTKLAAGGGCTPSVEAAAVLARYSGLTTVESDAICAFVNEQVINGNWALVDECFMFSLFTAANAKIGMKSHTMTLEEGTETHVSGRGFSFDGATAFDTGYVGGSGGATAGDGCHGSQAISGDTSINRNTMGSSNNYKMDYRASASRLQWANSFTGGTVNNQTLLNTPYTLAVNGHNGTNWSTYLDGVLDRTAARATAAFPAESWRVGARRLGAVNGGFWLGIIAGGFISKYIGFDQAAWNTGFKLLQSTLEAG